MSSETSASSSPSRRAIATPSSTSAARRGWSVTGSSRWPRRAEIRARIGLSSGGSSTSASWSRSIASVSIDPYCCSAENPSAARAWTSPAPLRRAAVATLRNRRRARSISPAANVSVASANDVSRRSVALTSAPSSIASSAPA